MRENIGIDIGKRKCDVCVIDTKGNVLERRQYQNTTAQARRFAEDMARKYKKCRAACETTGNMWNITFDALEDAGIETKLANTFKMAIIARTGKKTDKVDAEKIAQVLRMDMIPECYVSPPDIRGIRAMIRHQIRMVHDRRVINRVHSMLDRHDVTVDAVNMYAKELWRLESVRLKSSHDGMVLGQCVRQIRHLTEEVAVVDEYLEKESSNNEGAQLVASMTGFGTYSALLIAVEIGNISRFDSPKKLVSWAGLCPTVHKPGDRT